MPFYAFNGQGYQKNSNIIGNLNVSSAIFVGGEVSSHSFGTAGDIICKRIEVNGVSYFDTGILLADNAGITFGSGNDCRLIWRNVPEPDCLILGLDGSANIFLICERADDIDWAHPNQTNPTLFIQSASATPAHCIKLYHNQTNGVIASEAGGLYLGSTTCAPIAPSMTTTQRNALSAVNGMRIYNTTTASIEMYSNGAWRTPSFV